MSPRCLHMTMITIALLLVAGCAPRLMPTPSIFPASGVDPFAGLDPAACVNETGIFFVTDRMPVDPDDPMEGFTDQRAHELLLGAATITIGPGLDWQQLRDASLDPRRTHEGGPVLELDSVSLFGPLGSTVHDDGEISAGPVSGTRAFVRAIDERLAASSTGDVYVFVHGYKSDFERPLSVAAELGHYLGRDAVLIAYCWAARDALLGYVHDRDSALYSVGHFRRLLECVADETDARRIHLIGHSTGASLVGRTLREMRLVNADLDPQQLLEKQRIGQVLFVAPDVDVAIFRSHFAEGFDEVPERMTVYVNPDDNALRFVSELIYGLTRLGDPSAAEYSRSEMEALARSPAVQIIDTSNARDSDDTGHRYYRGSPWVSSDLLLLLRTGWSAEQRGLVRTESDYAWHFPDDYEQTLAIIGALGYGQEPSSGDESAAVTAP